MFISKKITLITLFIIHAEMEIKIEKKTDDETTENQQKNKLSMSQSRLG